jgi:hypothetical protein
LKKERLARHRKFGFKAAWWLIGMGVDAGGCTGESVPAVLQQRLGGTELWRSMVLWQSPPPLPWQSSPTCRRLLPPNTLHISRPPPIQMNSTLDPETVKAVGLVSATSWCDSAARPTGPVQPDAPPCRSPHRSHVLSPACATSLVCLPLISCWTFLSPPVDFALFATNRRATAWMCWTGTRASLRTAPASLVSTRPFYCRREGRPKPDRLPPYPTTPTHTHTHHHHHHATLSPPTSCLSPLPFLLPPPPLPCCL